MSNLPGALDKIRILIVDDDPGSLEAVAALLELNGAEVQTARGVSDARRLLRYFKADLVISDIKMPSEDGFDLIMGIRKLPSTEGGRTPAIAISGSSDSLSRARALAYGFQEYLPKPVEPGFLISTVVALARRKLR